MRMTATSVVREKNSQRGQCCSPTVVLQHRHEKIAPPLVYDSWRLLTVPRCWCGFGDDGPMHTDACIRIHSELHASPHALRAKPSGACSSARPPPPKTATRTRTDPAPPAPRSCRHRHSGPTQTLLWARGSVGPRRSRRFLTYLRVGSPL